MIGLQATAIKTDSRKGTIMLLAAFTPAKTTIKAAQITSILLAELVLVCIMFGDPVLCFWVSILTE
jgi:hypothetical protein